MKLEICANSFESALAAQDAGAHRIELCQELSLGGITPSHGLIEKVLQELEIPVFVLIRPRSGDFMYSEAEFDVMSRDIAFAKAQGAQGIVSGILNRDFTIDAERTKQLIAECGELPFTFHRAFDWTPDVFEALELLINIGATRVLTAGRNANVNGGYKTLLELQAAARNRIVILPGGGISIDNVMKFKKEGFSEVHGSLSSSTLGYNHVIKMHSLAGHENNLLQTSNVSKIKALLSRL
ncbi:copper homeostasis protein CutC [Dokdonia sp. PRO95]|uniref:copper homeostasis protein CutC n=1 Tax=Dokdonia sp. PRO95 TaxID=1239415 RepID=UPI000552B052|nr:copper homeostasis protein CutC [Dokdonia sp. PRO95]